MQFDMYSSDGALKYKSRSQLARFFTESWAAKQVPCPQCGGYLGRYANNSPVADFFCFKCGEAFELKSSSKPLGHIIPDGTYKTMLERLASNTNPNLFLLHYDASFWLAKSLVVIPKYYFTQDIIQQRPALSSTAKRAGWVGCNILIGNIPKSGFISIFKEQVCRPLQDIHDDWARTKFLAKYTKESARGWLLSTMHCIEKIGRNEFSLDELYQYEPDLFKSYPKNNHIKAKLRQQLQILRDLKYLQFTSKGTYKLL